jgi:hypothetical protein
VVVELKVVTTALIQPLVLIALFQVLLLLVVALAEMIMMQEHAVQAVLVAVLVGEVQHVLELQIKVMLVVLVQLNQAHMVVAAEAVLVL